MTLTRLLSSCPSPYQIEAYKKRSHFGRAPLYPAEVYFNFNALLDRTGRQRKRGHGNNNIQYFDDWASCVWFVVFQMIANHAQMRFWDAFLIEIKWRMFTFGGDYARLLFQNQLNSKLGLALIPYIWCRGARLKEFSRLLQKLMNFASHWRFLQPKWVEVCVCVLLYELENPLTQVQHLNLDSNLYTLFLTDYYPRHYPVLVPRYPAPSRKK